MLRRLLLLAATFAVVRPSNATEPLIVYVCAQPQAYDFWGAVVQLSHEIRVKLSDDTVIAQLAARQGTYCKRVASDNLRPVAFANGSTIGEGLVGLADGDNSVVLGWVTPEYYVQYAIAQHKRQKTQ